MRVRLLAAAGGLALAASLGACSDDDGDGAAGDAPADASLDDFCDTFNDLFDDVLAQATSGDSAAMVRALKSWASDMEDVGTPAEMPDDARRGFELFIDQADQLDEDATLADLERFTDDLSDADQADGEAFSDWTQDNCPLDLPDLPGSSE